MNSLILKNANCLTSRKLNGNNLKDLKILLKAIQKGMLDPNEDYVKKEIRVIVGFELPADLWKIVKDFLIVPASHPIWIVRGFKTEIKERMNYVMPRYISQASLVIYYKYLSEISDIKDYDTREFINTKTISHKLPSEFYNYKKLDKCAKAFIIQNQKYCCKLSRFTDISLDCQSYINENLITGDETCSTEYFYNILEKNNPIQHLSGKQIAEYILTL